MNLPENLRNALKKPIGILIKDGNVSRSSIMRLLSANSYIITVGDATTERLLGYNFVPSLQIIDGIEKRAKRNPIKTTAQKLFCDNPAGQITTQSIEVIRKAMGLKPPVQVVVNGEEDLLVIPCCIYAPHNAIVFYGQPNEGIVAVPVTEEIRNKTKAILNLMK